ncbi:Vms1/Ankzf1 family peptidyl-tRNA hydrolase, partial [Micromonospora maritima]
PGGWSQSRYQRAAMEAWHQNAGDAAAATADLAERVGADVVVVAGDVRATGMIAAQLPARWQDVLVRTDAGSRDPGADDTLMDDITVQTVAEVADRRIATALDRFGVQEDVGAGLDAVVAALQRNQVDTMLIVDDASADGELWVGPDPTEIATDPAQLAGMSVADPQKVRADAALLRALIGTDADVTVLAPEEAPELTDGVGAVLRYVDAGTPGRGDG